MGGGPAISVAAVFAAVASNGISAIDSARDASFGFTRTAAGVATTAMWALQQSCAQPAAPISCAIGQSGPIPLMPIGQVDPSATMCIAHVRPAPTGNPASRAITHVAANWTSRFIRYESIDPFRSNL